MFPDEHIFVSSPPIAIPEGLLERYVSLYKGLRSRLNPITWRSFITETKVLLGSSIPDRTSLEQKDFRKAKKLVKFLLSGTHMENLYYEALFALGFKFNAPKEKLDLLLVNAHHTSEPLFWAMVDEAKKEKKNFAAINPVGHYNDQQIRVLSPVGKYFSAKKIVILSSTQGMYGGGVTLLINVMRILRNKYLVENTKSIDIVIPMFGGSRGHKFAQLPEIGYEVLEMINNPKMLCLMIRDVRESLLKEKVTLPPVRFYSVDIHNDELPAEIFARYELPFTNILPANEIAQGVLSIFKEKRMRKIPLYLAACDEGAVGRAEALIEELLKKSHHYFDKIMMVYIEKERKQAGLVVSAKIDQIVSYKITGGKLIKKNVAIPRISYKPYVLLYVDDMIDTGGTAKKDMDTILAVFPNPRIKVFSATHPIFSKGLTPIDTLGVDVFLIGNTLKVPEISTIPKIRTIDVSRSVYTAVFKNN